MKRPAIYSRPSGLIPEAAERGQVEQPIQVARPKASLWQKLRTKLRSIAQKHPQTKSFALGVALMAGVFAIFLSLQPAAQKLTQEDIDAAVLSALENVSLPSAAARAYEEVIPAVVRVRSFVTPRDKKGNPLEEEQMGVGTGVVIVDKGVILTNLHVVQGSQRLEVTFMDGQTSSAHITGVKAEDDLAVLQAHTIPDDLSAAALASTANLRPGDLVAAVGFPFGIGPSVSAGVVSGLKRNFISPETNTNMTNLIQFDAAANPGNSGGPLVNADGEVVGIVTGILNPSKQRVFIGIGFAVPIENAASAVGMSPF
jgi:S1-C subfamily serine protease